MVRGDDIYLLDVWPLDNLNLVGAGASYQLDGVGLLAGQLPGAADGLGLSLGTGGVHGLGTAIAGAAHALYAGPEPRSARPRRQGSGENHENDFPPRSQDRGSDEEEAQDPEELPDRDHRVQSS